MTFLVVLGFDLLISGGLWWISAASPDWDGAFSSVSLQISAISGILSLFVLISGIILAANLQSRTQDATNSRQRFLTGAVVVSTIIMIAGLLAFLVVG